MLLPFIIYIFFIFLQIFNCDNSYLYKYDQLYYSQTYEVRLQYSFQNYTLNFVCNNPAIDCAGHGTCHTNNCLCDVGYYTIPGSYVKCTYPQKILTNALLLEAVIGFGFGHLYRGNLIFFVAKFLFYFFGCYFYFCIILCVGALNNSNVDAKTYYYTKRSSYIIIPIMIGWYFVDIVMFLLGKYTDSNGLPLY